MYCSNCGYELTVKEREKALSSGSHQGKSNTQQVFVCPRCGKIIKEGLNEEEIKGVARASHSEIHKANNKLNTAKSSLVIGAILFAIGLLFFILCFKPKNNNKFELGCTEFYVFIALSLLSITLIVLGIVFFVSGTKKKKKYSELLKDIQNGVFKQ